MKYGVFEVMGWECIKRCFRAGLGGSEGGTWLYQPTQYNLAQIRLAYIQKPAGTTLDATKFDGFSVPMQ